MATRKSNFKTSFPTEKVAELLQEVLDRWKSKSPKAARIATDALFWTGVAASIVPLLPVPNWIISVTLIAGSVFTKLTKE
jgi:hypothetical protein